VYPYPSLEPILKDTCGILMYHDQVSQAASDIAGYSSSRADLLRRTMGKKKYDDLEKERELFREGAAKTCALKSAEADVIFYFLVLGAARCTNRAHAIAYATISYRMAYCKAHWPLRFLAACLCTAFVRGSRPPKWPCFSGELW